MDKFTLLIDDFCPQITKDHHDFKCLMKLMDDYPIKVTMFIPADHREIMVEHPLQYSNFSFCHLERMQRWSDWANSLASDRIELAMHGVEHWHYGNHNCREFVDLSENETEVKINRMIKIFKAIPNVTRGFRPPGHGTNPYLYDILVKKEFKYICLHAHEHSIKKGPLKIIESGRDGVMSAHFGCLANGCIHKSEPMIRERLNNKKYEFLRVCDR